MQLASIFQKFVEAGGKEKTVLQRLRASALVGFLVDALRVGLRMVLGAAVQSVEPAEETMIRAYAERMGPERLFAAIEKCLEADYQIDRRVQLILVIESLLHHFTRS